MKSILDISVSIFKDVHTPNNSRTVNLLMWLRSEKYKHKVEEIRKSGNKELKKQLPAITPSGIFTYRELKYLTNHTGFIGFDIDFADNQHITNYTDLKEQLKNIQNIAYVGLSVSGRGYWGLIPISNPEKHKEHFQAIFEDFQRYGINLDKSGSDVTRLRIYSYDPEAYFNHRAKTYTKLFKPKPQPAPKYSTPTSGDNREKVEKVLSEISLQRIDITGDYQQWFALGCALANEFGEGGRGYFHSISQYHSGYRPNETDKQFKHCLSHSYSYEIATLFYYADRNGIHFKEIAQKTEPIKLLSKAELNELALKHIGEFNHISGRVLSENIGMTKLSQLIDKQIITEIKSNKNHFYITGNYPF